MKIPDFGDMAKQNLFLFYFLLLHKNEQVGSDFISKSQTPSGKEGIYIPTYRGKQQFIMAINPRFVQQPHYTKTIPYLLLSFILPLTCEHFLTFSYAIVILFLIIRKLIREKRLFS